MMQLYKPYLEKFPKADFASLLSQRYSVAEAKQMTTVQLSDFVTFMQQELGVEQKKAVEPKGPKPPTDSERKDLWEASKANGWTAEQMTAYLKAAFGVSSSKLLNRPQFELLRDISPKVRFDVAFAEVAPSEEDVP